MIKRFLLLCMFFQSISVWPSLAQKRRMNKGDGDSVKNLVIFPIYSEINVIQKGNKAQTSEALSYAAEIEIRNKLEQYIPSDIDKHFFVCKNELEEEIMKWHAHLIAKCQKAVILKNVEVPNFLINLLDSIDQNYSLFIFHNGFTRTPENLKTEYIKRRNIALATLGFSDKVPNKSFSVMIGLLIDKKRKRISMYKELYWRDRNPNEEVVIKAQMRDLILGYFQHSK